MFNYEKIMSNYKNLNDKTYKNYLKKCPYLFTMLWLIKEDSCNERFYKQILNFRYLTIQADFKYNYLPDVAEILLKKIFGIDTDNRDENERKMENNIIKISEYIKNDIAILDEYFECFSFTDDILGDEYGVDEISTFTLYFDPNFIYYFIIPIFEGKFDKDLERLYARVLLEQTLS